MTGELRLAQERDIPALKALWKLVFGDTDELIDAFFELLFIVYIKQYRC